MRISYLQILMNNSSRIAGTIGRHASEYSLSHKALPLIRKTVS
jgi:hypothetical protein